MNTATLNSPQSTAPRAWWQEPMLWLVVGGPALVVVAAIGTAVIAIRNADPVLPTTVQRVAADDAVEGTHPKPAVLSGADAPAMQARNHVMTPSKGQ